MAFHYNGCLCEMATEECDRCPTGCGRHFTRCNCDQPLTVLHYDGCLCEMATEECDRCPTGCGRHFTRCMCEFGDEAVS